MSIEESLVRSEEEEAKGAHDEMGQRIRGRREPGKTQQPRSKGFLERGWLTGCAGHINKRGPCDPGGCGEGSRVRPEVWGLSVPGGHDKRVTWPETLTTAKEG